MYPVEDWTATIESRTMAGMNDFFMSCGFLISNRFGNRWECIVWLKHSIEIVVYAISFTMKS
jgi:hypothetical protein